MSKLLTVPEAAEVLNVGEGYVRRLIFERRIPVVKVGRHVRIDARDVDDIIEAGRRPAEQGAS